MFEKESLQIVTKVQAGYEWSAILSITAFCVTHSNDICLFLVVCQRILAKIFKTNMKLLVKAINFLDITCVFCTKIYHMINILVMCQIFLVAPILINLHLTICIARDFCFVLALYANLPECSLNFCFISELQRKCSFSIKKSHLYPYLTVWVTYPRSHWALPLVSSSFMGASDWVVYIAIDSGVGLSIYGIISHWQENLPISMSNQISWRWWYFLTNMNAVIIFPSDRISCDTRRHTIKTHGLL